MIKDFIDRCVKKHGNFLISILQEIQKRHKYLPMELLKIVAEKLKISLGDIYGVASFYNSFSFSPKGKHIVTVCLGTACHVRGGSRIVESLSRELGVEPGDTTKDLKFTLETVNCLGCCAIGPIVVVDGKYYGEMTPQKAIECIRKIGDGNMSKLRSEKQIEDFRERIKESRDSQKLTISISSGTCSQARGSLLIVKEFKEAIKGHEDKISIKITGCHGFCNAEPNVIIFPQGIFYKNLKSGDPARIVESLLKNEIIDDLIMTENGEKFIHLHETPFYKNQMRLILGDSSNIDPISIEDYIAVGGYKAIGMALNMSPEDIIEEVKNSGLRGRGGAGFPTGKKWEIARSQKGDIKHLICNADEGDPGAYMDRSVLEGNPHSVIEGMIIGAYAIGATEGWIYVRDEYPLAVKHFSKAIKQAKKLGLLGKKIFGRKFNFDIRIARGAGAFVCGEETALIQSIEGLRGVPRQRPPFPAQQGLFGKPTNINNVETFANIPKIIQIGANRFKDIGTKTSKGTKIFSLVGKIKNTGLVEIPMGTSLRKVIFDIGGGSPNGKKIKAVQTGGPSGGCIPENLFDLPIDYESLSVMGSIMGSGGMIVMDEDTCMVDVARYFTNFLQGESCGKCVPCREGIQRMHEILTNIVEGKGEEKDIELLRELAVAVKDTSMCGLGQTSPNPILSTLRYFMDEYLAHVKDKKCPAHVCKSLIRYQIDKKLCKGCTMCQKNCPQKAIVGEPKKTHSISEEKCIKCGICHDVCKFKAIIVS